MGHIGCSINAIEYYEEKCNGNTTCKFLIPDGHLERKKPCKNNELKNYLDIGYDCVKGNFFLNPTLVAYLILRKS